MSGRKRERKPMTEAQREKARERCRRYRATEKGKATCRACRKRWTEKNRERLTEQYRRTWLLIKADPERHEKIKSAQRKWQRKMRLNDCYRADKAARQAEWRTRNREHYNQWMRKYRKSHPYDRYAYERARMERDAAYYAAVRARSRRKSEVKAAAEGRVYSPRISMRIPDWCVKGEAERIARRSPLIRENCSDERLAEYDGYAWEIYNERKEAGR